MIYKPIAVPNSSIPRLPTPPIHNRYDKRTAFESPTLRYLKHPSYPLHTPHSSCKNTTILKKNRPAGGSLSTFPCFHPKNPISADWWFINRTDLQKELLRHIHFRWRVMGLYIYCYAEGKEKGDLGGVLYSSSWLIYIIRKLIVRGGR